MSLVVEFVAAAADVGAAFVVVVVVVAVVAAVAACIALRTNDVTKIETPCVTQTNKLFHVPFLVKR